MFGLSGLTTIVGFVPVAITILRFALIWAEDQRFRRPMWLATYAVLFIMTPLLAILTRLAGMAETLSNTVYIWVVVAGILSYAAIAIVRRGDLKAGRYTQQQIDRGDKSINDIGAGIMLFIILAYGPLALFKVDGHGAAKLTAIALMLAMVAVIFIDGKRNKSPYQQTY